VVKSRTDLAEHKRPYAHDRDFNVDPFRDQLYSAQAIIGVCGQTGIFTERIFKRMAEINDRPIIFALSNPTSRAECTAEDAYRLTNGRAIFASGSPFDPVFIDGKKLIPGQGNNAYIFPGFGLSIIVSESRRVTNEMFLAAAHALASEVTEADLAEGRIIRPSGSIVSLTIAMQPRR
jgi:malate dehydrogenase (oxaloacetate-decarboxylating)(NADP+)